MYVGMCFCVSCVSVVGGGGEVGGEYMGICACEQ